MAETLLAIALVTSSARGFNIVCRWPPSPQSEPRLSRPRPSSETGLGQLDNPWRAANYPDEGRKDPPVASEHTDVDWEYIWQRPNVVRDRSLSFSHSTSHSASGRTSPTKDCTFGCEETHDGTPLKDDYDDFLGHSSELLASLLCPPRALSHQKFELVIDGLCFIGHPVYSEPDGSWRFKLETVRQGGRGRGSMKRDFSGEALAASIEIEPEEHGGSPSVKEPWLQMFHLVFVHDLPDTSSSASGNIEKYFDIIYEQVAFTITAVLFQEQVLSNFVESECDNLGALQDDCARKGMWLQSPATDL